MTHAERKELIRSHFEEFVNRKNLRIGEVNFAPEFMNHGADVPPGMPPGPAVVSLPLSVRRCGGTRGYHDRLVFYREIHRPGNEAHLMRAGVKSCGFFDAAWIGDDGVWFQDDLSKLPCAICMRRHGSGGVVTVFRHHNASITAEVKKPEHVAGR